MKKCALCFLTIVTVTLLSACGNGISPEDYATLVSENTSLKTEIESLSAENQTLSEKNVELLDSMTEQSLEQLADAATTAWINTSFGDNSIILTNSEQQYVQCIASNTYPISEDGIANLWDDLLLSIKTLAYVKDTIPYKSISIRFLDSSGEHILDVTLNMDESSPVLQAMMFNVAYSDVIAPAIQKIIAE